MAPSLTMMSTLLTLRVNILSQMLSPLMRLSKLLLQSSCLKPTRSDDLASLISLPCNYIHFYISIFQKLIYITPFVSSHTFSPNTTTSTLSLSTCTKLVLAFLGRSCICPRSSLLDDRGKTGCRNASLGSARRKPLAHSKLIINSLYYIRIILL